MLYGLETQYPWDIRGWVPDKPAASEYGYVSRSDSIGCSLEELKSVLVERGIAAVRLAWTPETPQPVFPEEIPELVGAFKRIHVRDARKSVLIGAGLVAFGVVLALVFQDWKFFYLNMFSIFGAVSMAEGVWGLTRSRHYSQEDAIAEASGLRFESWIKNKKITGYTFALGASIVVVGVFQVLAGLEVSVASAGLVKSAVRQGDFVRL